jgi:hypothetical protein
MPYLRSIYYMIGKGPFTSITMLLALTFSLNAFLFAKEKQNGRDSILVQTKILETRITSGNINHSDYISLGRLYFYLAVDDKTYLEKGTIFFSEIKDLPKSPYIGESEMYIQALNAIRAKNALWPADKWSIANKALAEMDKIILKYPDNIEIRFIRASTCYYLPFFFNRKEQVKNDFIILSKLIPNWHDKYPLHLIRNICDFMIKSGYLSPQQNTQIQRFYKTIT